MCTSYTNAAQSEHEQHSQPNQTQDAMTTPTHAPPHPAAIGLADLQQLTGYTRPADIERWCKRNGVRYFLGKQGAWTTIDAVNAALGVTRNVPPKPTRLEF